MPPFPPVQDYKNYYTDQLAFYEEISGRKMKYRVTAAVFSVLRNVTYLANVAAMLEHCGESLAHLSLDHNFQAARLQGLRGAIHHTGTAGGGRKVILSLQCDREGDPV
jgi:hypothetical protein